MMKKFFAFLLVAVLLAGCAAPPAADTAPSAETAAADLPEADGAQTYVSRFDTVTQILLSDAGIALEDETKQDAVFVSRDIICYEDRETYNSGNPYGEGTPEERHTQQEAAAHTVVNITAPGAYRISGKLSAGQIRVDLGKDAYDDPDAVVELILQNADITCTVAPAILFLNTYECDGGWSVETAQPQVDTGAAGANLILQGENRVCGSHVAKIFKDSDEEKKLWKQDGAIYSYMSMNVHGPGSLDLTADNEGLDTELHLSIHSGDIRIRAGNDGINTNEDGVSVTTINGGSLLIHAGLGEEGDGIDSNGYLVINGGTVAASAHPGADAGMDADLGSYIHGGRVIALGSTMDWAESASGQVTMNLQFSEAQEPGLLEVRDGGETVIFSWDLAEELGFDRSFTGAILSFPELKKSAVCFLTLEGTTLAYTGTDVGRGGFGGGKQPPEGFSLPEDADRQEDFGRGPGGPDRPENFGELPEGMDGMPFPEDGEKMPFPGNGVPEGTGRQEAEGQLRQDFFMADMVNCFSGIRAVQ